MTTDPGKTVFIYALKEPDTGEIRYIGKSDNPERRLKSHLSSAKKAQSHRAYWIRSLQSLGKVPLLEILDEVLYEHWQAWEAAYIEFFRESGCKLVNGTPGGDGVGSGLDNVVFGIRKTGARLTQAQEAIKKGQKVAADKLRGVPKTGERLEQILAISRQSAENSRGVAKTGKQLEQILAAQKKGAEARRGVPMTVEQRIKISEGLKKSGWVQKNADALRGVPLTGVRLENTLAAGRKGNEVTRGVPRTPEVRAKVGASVRKAAEIRRHKTACIVANILFHQRKGTQNVS